jgi:hypothetical protein
MIRTYTDGTKSDITMFTGIEIEKTVFFGEQTLFVVGIKDINDIISIANENKCTHIYLGANHSFKKSMPISILDQIQLLLNLAFKVTVDVPVKNWSYVSRMLNTFKSNYNFAINLSVPIPNIEEFKHINIKIDDIGFDKTNSGVWIYKLNENDKTYWYEYAQDKIIDNE